MINSRMAREMGRAQRQQDQAKEGENSPEVKSCIPEEGCCTWKLAGSHMVRVTLHIASDLFNPAFKN